MEISKSRLKEIIKEEIELSRQADKEISLLMESYIETHNYGVKKNTVPKEAIIDLLEVLSEEELPVETLEAIINTLPEDTVKTVLKEFVE
jgi:VIT1/CCC1 family predicted Fe2+/Mn2+ transporter